MPPGSGNSFISLWRITSIFSTRMNSIFKTRAKRVVLKALRIGGRVQQNHIIHMHDTPNTEDVRCHGAIQHTVPAKPHGTLYRIPPIREWRSHRCHPCGLSWTSTCAHWQLVRAYRECHVIISQSVSASFLPGSCIVVNRRSLQYSHIIHQHVMLPCRRNRLLSAKRVERVQRRNSHLPARCVA